MLQWDHIETIWEPSGFCVHRDGDKFSFSQLNPDTQIGMRLSRFERLQMALWFLVSIFSKA